MVGGSYCLATTVAVFVETPGVYVDDNEHIAWSSRRHTLKLAGYLQKLSEVALRCRR